MTIFLNLCSYNVHCICSPNLVETVYWLLILMSQWNFTAYTSTLNYYITIQFTYVKFIRILYRKTAINKLVNDSCFLIMIEFKLIILYKIKQTRKI